MLLLILEGAVLLARIIAIAAALAYCLAGLINAFIKWGVDRNA